MADLKSKPNSSDTATALPRPAYGINALTQVKCQTSQMKVMAARNATALTNIVDWLLQTIVPVLKLRKLATGLCTVFLNIQNRAQLIICLMW
jgi:hypothetical protein